MRSIGRIYLICWRSYPKILIVGYAAVLLAGLSALAIPRVLSTGIDRALDPNNADRGVEALVTLGVVLALLGIARGFFQGGQMFMGENLAQRVAYKIRNDYFEKLMAAFDKFKNEHIAVYGPDNHLRLTGLHETQSIDKFNYGVANRGASVRVPHSFVDNGYKGYLEDRRPNSQGDPYRIAGRILQTIATVPK